MAELSERLRKLTAALRPLHLALTKETQVAYERQHGPVQGPGELLQLLIRHPDFAWLHPLSELMAVADELLDPLPRDPPAPRGAGGAAHRPPPSARTRGAARRSRGGGCAAATARPAPVRDRAAARTPPGS